MELIALVVAQAFDPIRWGLVVATVWVVSKAFARESRMVPLAGGLFAAAVLSSLLLSQMQVVNRTTVQWALVTIIGFLVNCLIAAICIGAIRLYRGRTA